MRTGHLLVAACLAVAGMSALIAQTVDGLDLEAVKRRVAEQATDATALAEQVKSRGDAFRADAEETAKAGQKALQRVAKTELPKGRTVAIDFDELVAGAAHNAAVPRGEAPQLIVFASLSMPPASLKPLIADTARAGGVVVFRGFPGNSAKAFTTALARSIGDDRALANIGIDPRLFRAFAIEAVPAFVVVSSDFDLCAGLNCRSAVPPHDRVTGNVTLDYALSTFADGQGPGARVAAVGLARMRKSAP